jgi:pilus assembly protein CpaF
MLQAMNTGHDGSMTTVHANSPRDALTRLENMIGMGGLTLPPKAMRQQISSAINVVLQISRLSDGKRKITSVQELTGMEGDIITMHEIFGFNQTGVDANGAVRGQFRASGIRPKFMDRIRAYGVKINESLFDPAKVYE